jgi:hypothetical protein
VVGGILRALVSTVVSSRVVTTVYTLSRVRSLGSLAATTLAVLLAAGVAVWEVGALVVADYASDEHAARTCTEPPFGLLKGLAVAGVFAAVALIWSAFGYVRRRRHGRLFAGISIGVVLLIAAWVAVGGGTALECAVGV